MRFACGRDEKECWPGWDDLKRWKRRGMARNPLMKQHSEDSGVRNLVCDLTVNTRAVNGDRT